MNSIDINEDEVFSTFSKEMQLKYLTDKQSILDENISDLRNKILAKKIEYDYNKKRIDKLTFDVEACKLDYYHIRKGLCKYAETAGHNGEVFCSNPNCTNK